MPPRRANRKQVIAETQPQTTQVRRSRRPQHAAPSEESFVLANISSDEGEEEDRATAQPPIDTETIPEIDSGINNPDIVVTPKNQADDIAFFYDKLPDKYECVICR
jgi:hypothetical protein